MGLFISRHVNKVDRKGRVSVPASFRAALAEQSFQGIVVYPSFTQEGVVEGCGMDFLERLAAAGDREFDVFSPKKDDFNALIYASAHTLAWDPEGRVVLPESILQCLAIDEQVAFVGNGRTFQLWRPEAHDIYVQAAKTRALGGDIQKFKL